MWNISLKYLLFPYPLKYLAQYAQRLYRMNGIKVESIVSKHGIEEATALVVVKTNLAKIADIALEHIMKQTSIFGR